MFFNSIVNFPVLQSFDDRLERSKNDCTLILKAYLKGRENFASVNLLVLARKRDYITRDSAVVAADNQINEGHINSNY